MTGTISPYVQFHTALRKIMPHMEIARFHAFSYSNFRKIVEGVGGEHPEAGATFLDIMPEKGQVLLMQGLQRGVV